MSSKRTNVNNSPLKDTTGEFRSGHLATTTKKKPLASEISLPKGTGAKKLKKD